LAGELGATVRTHAVGEESLGLSPLAAGRSVFATLVVFSHRQEVMMMMVMVLLGRQPELEFLKLPRVCVEQAHVEVELLLHLGDGGCGCAVMRPVLQQHAQAPYLIGQQCDLFVVVNIKCCIVYASSIGWVTLP
jgi:hypothetical protein